MPEAQSYYAWLRTGTGTLGEPASQRYCASTGCWNALALRVNARPKTWKGISTSTGWAPRWTPSQQRKVPGTDIRRVGPWRRARPALEGPHKRRRLSIPGHVGHLGDTHVGLLQMVLGRLASCLIQQSTEALATLGQPPLERLATYVQLIGNRIDTGRAFWKPLADKFSNLANGVGHFGGWSDNLLASLLQDAQELVIGTLSRQTWSSPPSRPARPTRPRP